MKLGNSPARALAYKPLVSRFSTTTIGASTKTSKKSLSPMISLASERSASKGEMKETMVTMPASTKSFVTSATRRMFSARSVSVKPKSAFRPWRTLSPSRTKVRILRWCNMTSRALAIVLLPLPDNPVSHTTKPFCSFINSRCSRPTVSSCHCTFSERRKL